MTETTLTALSGRIKQDGITITVRRTEGAGPSSIPDLRWRRSADWWSITLRMAGRSFTVPFGKGPGHGGEAPTRQEVLYAMLSDASMLAGCRDQRDWLRDYGMDDDETPDATYRAVQIQTAKLTAFLGDRYDAYLTETDYDS